MIQKSLNTNLRVFKVIFVLLLSSCASPGKETQEIKGAKVTFDMKIGPEFNEGDSYEVFYYKNLVAFKQPYTHDSIVNNKLIKTNIEYKFFVFEKDSKTGYWYDPFKRYYNEPTPAHLDSVLAHLSHNNGNYEYLAGITPDTTYTDSNGDLVKIYNDSSNTPNIANNDLYFYYSTKFNHIDESLSTIMDKENQLKLYKVKTNIKETYIDSLKQKMPAGSLLLEMHQVKEIPKELPGLFDDYLNKKSTYKS